jgi:predicted nucleic acid-binding protein
LILLDTSAWVEILRKPARLRLDDVAELDEVATCLPVVQEVLQGIRDEGAFRTAREALFSFPMVESPLREDVFESAVFESAVDLYRAARRAGLTVRSGVDCVIAACAMRNGLLVAHHDRDFAALARVSPLQEREVLP